MHWKSSPPPFIIIYFAWITCVGHEKELCLLRDLRWFYTAVSRTKTRTGLKLEMHALPLEHMQAKRLDVLAEMARLQVLHEETHNLVHGHGGHRPCRPQSRPSCGGCARGSGASVPSEATGRADGEAAEHEGACGGASEEALRARCFLRPRWPAVVCAPTGRPDGLRGHQDRCTRGHRQAVSAGPSAVSL